MTTHFSKQNKILEELGRTPKEDIEKREQLIAAYEYEGSMADVERKLAIADKVRQRLLGAQHRTARSTARPPTFTPCQMCGRQIELHDEYRVLTPDYWHEACWQQHYGRVQATVNRYRAILDGMADTLEVQCDDCEGTGRIFTPAYQSGGEIVDEQVQDCITCGGTGYVEKEAEGGE